MSTVVLDGIHDVIEQILRGQDDINEKMDQLQKMVEEQGTRLEEVSSRVDQMANHLGVFSGPGASLDEIWSPQTGTRKESDIQVVIDETSWAEEMEELDTNVQSPTNQDSENTKVHSTVVKIRNLRKIYPENHPKPPMAKGQNCVFCAGPHLSDTCYRIQSAIGRRKLLNRNKVCVQCLTREAHICTPRKCTYCQEEDHHPALCKAPKVQMADNLRYSRRKPEKPTTTRSRCPFCQHHHHADSCPAEMDERIRIVTSTRRPRCAKCLKRLQQGDNRTSGSEDWCSGGCRAECEYCGCWEHHGSLCEHADDKRSTTTKRPNSRTRDNGAKKIKY